MLQATLVPQDLKLEELLSLNQPKLQAPGSLVSYMSTLKKMSTAPKEIKKKSQTLVPYMSTSMDAFADNILETFLNDESTSDGTNNENQLDDNVELYKQVDKILQTKLISKNRLQYGKPMTKDQLIHIFYNFTMQLKRNGTLFFGCVDPQVPLGLALRTPTYLTTLLCIDILRKQGVIELLTENDGNRVLIKGRPKCYELSDKLAGMIENVAPNLR